MKTSERIDPALVADYVKPLTEEEINAMTPQERLARLTLLKQIQANQKSEKKKGKFSERLRRRVGFKAV